MKIYKNKKTGAVLETESKITGDNWEQVKEKKGKSPEKPEDLDTEKEPEE